MVQVDPIESRQEEYGKKGHHFDVDDAAYWQLIQFIYEEHLSPNRHLFSIPAHLEFPQLFLFLPVDEEVVGGIGQIEHLYEYREEKKWKIDIENGQKHLIYIRSVAADVDEGEVDRSLEFVEAEDVTREEDQHYVDAHRQVFDDVDKEEKNGFETVVRVVVLVGVVFHVSVEINDENDEHPSHEHSQKSGEI